MSGLTALGADIFAGGFSLGIQRAGFNVLAHFEENNYGLKTTNHNFPNLPVHVGFDSWPVDDFKDKDIDLIFANPPCAAWSPAGHTAAKGPDKWKLDPRKDCTIRCMTLRTRLRPKIYVTESVTQAWTKGREFFEPLMAEAAEEGYATTVLLHDAQWLGLPQCRKRVFFVFHRIGFSVQAPNWAPPPVPLDFLPEEPVGEAMIEKPHYFTEKRIKKVKPGERLAKFWERTTPEEKRTRNALGGLVGRPAFGHVRLPVDRPGGATVGYCIIHPTQHRFLSTEEIQLLSGFPADYHFTPGGKNARAAEIARGVCPTVGEWLGKQCRAAIEMNVPLTEVTQRVVDFRRPPASVDDTQTHRVILGQPDADERPAKVAASPREGKPVAPKPVQTVMVDVIRMPKPKETLGSGNYIKLLLDMEKWTTEEIVAAVRQHYPNSKATGADVAYQRGEMRAAGRMVGVVKVNVAGVRSLTPYVKKVLEPANG